MYHPPNGPFYLGPAPKPKDRRKYNAFGILLGFGKAYAAYYRKRDNRSPRNPSTK